MLDENNKKPYSVPCLIAVALLSAILVFNVLWYLRDTPACTVQASDPLPVGTLNGKPILPLPAENLIPADTVTAPDPMSNEPNVPPDPLLPPVPDLNDPIAEPPFMDPIQ